MEIADHCTGLVRQADADRYLATLYVPAALRAAAFALHALDLEIMAVVRSTTEPMLGQIRLAWWREQLQALDMGTPNAAPVLRAIAGEVLPRGVRGASLEPLEDAALLLLQGEMVSEQIAAHAVGRGGTLFEAILRLSDTNPGDDDVAAARDAGTAWALADLLRRADAEDDVAGIVDLARRRLAALASRPQLPAGARSLAGLAQLARADVDAVAAAGFDPAKVDWRRGTPGRQMRLLWSMVSGR